MNLTLFYVRADIEGENQDLLVIAEKAEDCAAIWREHYELASQDKPMWVGEVPGVAAVANSKPGAVDWGRINPT